MSDLEEYYKTEQLPLALVIAGIKEIEKHGLSDFSLRRVANACGVSCAAPYRHFKSKNDLILAIISYVNSQWKLLQDQIIISFDGDVRRQLIELCMANIRFWTANPNFRHIMLMDSSELDEKQKAEQSRSYYTLRSLTEKFCRENTIDEKEGVRRALLARSTVYGATHMLESGELENSPDSFALLRSCFENIFS